MKTVMRSFQSFRVFLLSYSIIPTIKTFFKGTLHDKNSQFNFRKVYRYPRFSENKFEVHKKTIDGIFSLAIVSLLTGTHKLVSIISETIIFNCYINHAWPSVP